MDPTDLALCKILMLNSRTSIRELADKLNLSVAAVHARIQSLRDAGIITAFTARISLFAVGGSTVLVWGTSRAASNADILRRLKSNDHIYWVAFGGAGIVYVGAYLRSASELDATVSFIVKEAMLLEPTVGLLPVEPAPPEGRGLDRLDCRILRAMHRDARKSIADIAQEEGISAKTAGRRLGRMVHEGLAELSIDWYPDAANDIISIWHLDTKPGAPRDKAAALLANEYEPNLLFTMPMSNLPQFLLAATWSGSMKELRDLQTRLGLEKSFARVVPNVLYTGYMFDTWRDELLMKRAGAKDPAR